MTNRLKLHGFNNLTKSLGFNFYIMRYLVGEQAKMDFIESINEKYSAENLSKLLLEVSERIDATVLNVSKQDYEPTGASVTILLAEEPLNSETIVAHLDKSHLTVHTYPEHHPNKDVVSFRVDIDVATCGNITPLDVLDFLIEFFDFDMVTLDYRVRGFTRLDGGERVFIDHNITSIQDFIGNAILEKHRVEDVNLPQINIFHTKMIKKAVYEQSSEVLQKELDSIYKGDSGY